MPAYSAADERHINTLSFNLFVPTSSAEALESRGQSHGDKKANPNCYSHSQISLTTRSIVASVTVQFTPNGLNKTIFAFLLEHDIQRKKRKKIP